MKENDVQRPYFLIIIENTSLKLKLLEYLIHMDQGLEQMEFMQGQYRSSYLKLSVMRI